MAKELNIVAPTGSTVYALLVNAAGNLYNGTGVEPYNESSYGNYDIPMTEEGTSGIFTADFPSVLSAGSDFLIVYKLQAGGSPDPSDTNIGAGSYTIEDDERSSLLATLYSSGNAIDALIFNSAGLVWNGTTFEAYADGTYINYVQAATEYGTSGIYVAPFPAALTSGGPFTIYWKARAVAGSPNPTNDTVVGTGTYFITGEDGSIPGYMNGNDWLTYLRRAFVRTDKDQQLLDATKDTIDDVRRRMQTEDYEHEQTISDSIISLGDYQMDLERRFGVLVSRIVLMDSSLGKPLNKISKAQYDLLYRRYGTDQTVRGVPRDFCIFGGQVLVGPVPDKTTYIYKISFSIDDHAEITTDSIAVPYTDKYREIMKFGVLSKVYSDLKNDDQAAKYGTLFEDGIKKWERREDRNRNGVRATRYRGC